MQKIFPCNISYYSLNSLKKYFQIGSINKEDQDFFIQLKKNLNLDINIGDDILKSRIRDYEVILPEYNINEIKNYTSNNLNYLAKINITLDFLLNDKKVSSQTINFSDIPFATEQGIFIINGFNRVFVPVLVRKKGIHCFYNNIENSINCYIRPDNGKQVLFKIYKNKTSDIFFNFSIIKNNWLIFVNALFFNNISELFEYFFEKKKFVFSKDTTINELESKIIDFSSFMNLYEENSTMIEWQSKIKYFIIENKIDFEYYDISDMHRKYINLDLSNSFYNSSFCINILLSLINKTLGKQSSSSDIETFRKMFLDENFFEFNNKTIEQIKSKIKLNDNSPVLTKQIIKSTIFLLINVNEGLIPLDDELNLSNRTLLSASDILSIRIQAILNLNKKNIPNKINGFLLENETANLTSEEKINKIIKVFISNINYRNNSITILSSFLKEQSFQFLDQTNFAAEVFHKEKITFIGTSGLPSQEHSIPEIRNVHHSVFGRICGITTSEGPNAGLSVYAANHAMVDSQGNLLAKYFVVENGIVTDKIKYLSAEEEYNNDYFIAEYTSAENKKISKQQVLVKHKEKFLFIDYKKINLIEAYNNQIFSTAISLMPFLINNDANRVMTAANMNKQALPLLFPEKPLVIGGYENMIVEKNHHYFSQSTIDGIVTYQDNSIIIIENKETGEKLTKNLQILIKNNQNLFWSEKSLVKINQKIKTGDLISAPTSYNNDIICVGVNLRTAVLPYYGWNFEDSVVISQDLVDNDCFSTFISDEYIIEYFNTMNGEEIFSKDYANINQREKNNLGDDGIIKVGSQVKEGDVLVAKFIPKRKASLKKNVNKFFSKIFGQQALAYDENFFKSTQEGTILYVINETNLKSSKKSLGTIKIGISYKSKIKEGDKITGRHGNKMVISKILPTEDMPFTKEGEYAQVVINPLGVVSRMNIGQILELNTTLVMQPDKNNLSNEKSFITKDATCESVEKMLIEKNFRSDGRVQLFDGITSEPLKQEALFGYMYFLRLEHLVEKKFHARGIGQHVLITQQPVGGKSRKGGQRFGEMEIWVMQAYGATNTILEKNIYLSDDLVSKEEILKGIIYGKRISVSGESSTLKVFLNYLTSLGIKVTLNRKNNE